MKRLKKATHTSKYPILSRSMDQIDLCLCQPCNQKLLKFEFFFSSYKIYQLNNLIRSSEEKSKWLQDLYEAIEKVKNTAEDKINYSSLKSNSKIT